MTRRANHPHRRRQERRAKQSGGDWQSVGTSQQWTRAWGGPVRTKARGGSGSFRSPLGQRPRAQTERLGLGNEDPGGPMLAAHLTWVTTERKLRTPLSFAPPFPFAGGVARSRA